MDAQVDDKSQAMFDMAGKQMLATLTSDKAGEMLARDAKARGPEVAVTEALKMASDQMVKSASQAGVELPPEVVENVLEVVAKVIVGMMAKAGLVKDPEATFNAILAQLEAGPGEPDEDGHPEPDADQQGGPSDMDADNAPQGVLSQQEHPEPDEDQQGGPSDMDEDNQPQGVLAKRRAM